MLKRSRLIFASLMLVFAAVAVSGCSGRWHRPPDAEKILHKIDKRVDKLELNLNDGQKQKYEAFKKAVAAHINGSKASVAKSFAAFKEDSAKENTDLGGLFASLRDMNAKRSESLNDALAKLEDFYKSLDAGQRKKVLDELKSKADRFEKWIK